MKKTIRFLSLSMKILMLFFPLAFLSIEVAAEPADPADPAKIREEAEKNTQYLLGHVIQKAKALQDAYGSFSPYGAGLFPGGVVKYIWLAKPGETVREPEKALPVVRQVLSAQADSGRLLASAVVYRYGPDSAPQINVELEYISGYAVAVGTKFTLDSENKMQIGEAGMKAYPAKIFVKKAEKEGADEPIAGESEVKEPDVK